MFLYWIFINQISAPIKFLNFKRASQPPSQDSTFRWASRAFFQKIRHFESQIRRLWKLYYLFLKLGHRNSLLLGTGFCFLASDLFALQKNWNLSLYSLFVFFYKDNPKGNIQTKSTNISSSNNFYRPYAASAITLLLNFKIAMPE